MDFLNNCFVIYDSINRITVPYGSGHNGVDMGFRSPLETNPENDVYSAGRGVVIDIVDGMDNDPSAEGVASWGNYVLIEHTNGKRTRYAHLMKNTIPVSIGQQVYASTKIGRIGNSGYSFGAHLHFEVYENGARVDPTPYLTTYITPGEPYYPDVPPTPTGQKKKFPWFIYYKKRREKTNV